MTTLPRGEPTLTELDHVRLQALPRRGTALPPALHDLLDNADVVPSREVPADVVTLYARLQLAEADALALYQALQRATGKRQDPCVLDTFMAAMMTATVITYGLYATSIEALQQHGGRLIYTVPLVVFGLLRYTYQVHRGRGEDVSRDLLRDPWIVAAGIAWLAIFLATRLWR